MRVYPKNHSHKRWKVTYHSRLYRTRTKYFKTYMMARFDAFIEYHMNNFTPIDIIDQMEGDE